MQVTVELQDKFSYIPIVLLGFATLVITVFLIRWAIKEKTTKQKNVRKKKEIIEPKNVMAIKENYDRMLKEIESRYASRRLSDRQAYQELSRVIRQFVYEMTGIKVQNYTLLEIRGLNMPQLTTLIEECYVPEFAPDHPGEIQDSLKSARKVIKEWI